MSERRVGIALGVVSVLTFVACAGHAGPPFVTSPDAGSAPGYQSGSRVTLSDGAVVTLPNGSPVTTPDIKDARGNSITTAKGYAVTTPTLAAGKPTTTQYVEPTGGVSFKAPKDPPKLAFPKLGTYGFRETIIPDDGGAKSTRDLFFHLSSPDQHSEVRWQESNAQGGATVSDFYVETHGEDGLWLTSSTLNDSDNCDWTPRSPELPKSVVDKVNNEVSVESKCTTKLNGEDVEFTLRAHVRSIDYEDLIIGGVTYHCIKVVRDRVLTQGATELISTAHEWYAFDLGIRVKVLDHTVSKGDEEQRSQSRDLVLTSKP